MNSLGQSSIPYSIDRLCLAFPVACSRIVNSDFLCYQIYESAIAMKSQVVYFFAPPYHCKIQLMHKLKKHAASTASSS
jgi:hypothetical protein